MNQIVEKILEFQTWYINAVDNLHNKWVVQQKLSL